MQSNIKYRVKDVFIAGAKSFTSRRMFEQNKHQYDVQVLLSRKDSYLSSSRDPRPSIGLSAAGSRLCKQTLILCNRE
ncbi:hypothetical protein RRG08_012880 [Elysia crispata]|uniref:Uncharacterized protein n=1 Tax=Elysia crispata TaxID=231223 RepID=A0AAE1AT09_9GAST|nr:hypothetical protein RRG08_012880 [Elysia crispata]